MRGVDDGRDKQGLREQSGGQRVAPSSRRIEFANEGAGRAEIINTATEVGEDGWAQIAPFGDFPGQMHLIGADGRPEGQPRDAIQRMDQAAAQAMVAAFRNPPARVLPRIVRFLRGLPIFHGHPDMPGMENRYPDKWEKGVIADLAIRADGLYARPVFNNDGLALIARTTGLGFSARWSAEPAGEENGTLIFRPSELISAGLTLTPNLPVQAINDMNLTELIAALARMGVTVAADADLTAIVAAINAAADAAATAHAAAETQSANERAALNTATNRVTELEAQLVNERTARAGLLIDQAVREGRIPEAQRSTRLAEFAANFANAAAALAAIQPSAALPTQGARVQDAVHRTATVTDRQSSAMQAINERVKQGMTYDAAYQDVRKNLPHLLGLTNN